MIYLFWPTKFVPSWLERFTPTSPDACFGEIYHNGFGLVSNRGNKMHAYTVAGSFIKICGAKDIRLAGGLDGVVFHNNFLSFLFAQEGTS